MTANGTGKTTRPLEPTLYPPGRLLVDNMHAYGWNLAACGGVPALRAMLRKDVYVVGVGTEEAASSAVYARASSPLARLNGVGGAARLLRGKNRHSIWAPARTSFCWPGWTAWG